MKKKDELSIKKIAVLAKLSNGKIYQVALNEEEAVTVTTTIQLLHQHSVKILPNELETVSF